MTRVRSAAEARAAPAALSAGARRLFDAAFYKLWSTLWYDARAGPPRRPASNASWLPAERLRPIGAALRATRRPPLRCSAPAPPPLFDADLKRSR